MILNVDNREPKSMINHIKSLLENIEDLKVEITQLDLGDYVICDNNDSKLIIFERKSLNDLECSIKDGRYNEQSFRLNNESIHNHNIYYIIEGAIINYKNTNFVNTLYSSLVSLSYYKGFSILNSINEVETCEIIANFVKKIMRESKKNPYYDLGNNTSSNSNYLDVIKTTKKSNITKDNINSIMLMQIPGVSNIIANTIINKYNTIVNLVNELNNNINCLDSLKIETNNRKISKNVVENIKYYLIL